MDFTFMCTRIESREIYKTELQNSWYQILLTSYKTTIRDCIKKYQGNCEEDKIDKNDDNIDLNKPSNDYDFMIAFTSVRAAIDCAVSIQVALNNLEWPEWFKKFEQNQILNYSGTGPNRM